MPIWTKEAHDFYLEMANIEDRSFSRGVRRFLEAVAGDDLDAEELLSDFLLGINVAKQELAPFRLREVLSSDNAFRWLRSLVQTLAELGLPGVVMMFDEMDRNMSLSVRRRREIGDNLRQMIDYCGQSLLPNVILCYAVPPEFMDTIVPEYPALAHAQLQHFAEDVSVVPARLQVGGDEAGPVAVYQAAVDASAHEQHGVARAVVHAQALVFLDPAAEL